MKDSAGKKMQRTPLDKGGSLDFVSDFDGSLIREAQAWARKMHPYLSAVGAAFLFTIFLFGQLAFWFWGIGSVIVHPEWQTLPISHYIDFPTNLAMIISFVLSAWGLWGWLTLRYASACSVPAKEEEE